MSPKDYRRLIDQGRRTGDVRVFCACSNPAVDVSVGSPVCERCKEIEKLFWRTYTVQEEGVPA